MDDSLLRPQPLGELLEDLKEKTETAKAEEQEITRVVVTPAWEKVLELLSKKSDPGSIVARIREVVYDGKTTNAELGELVRVAIMTADDLKNTVDIVTETVKAHEK
jgi:hypothetical protein